MLIVAVVAAVLVVLAITTAAYTSLQTVAVACACISAFTLPWNGVLVGGQRPGDEFIFLALIIFAVAGLRSRLPMLPLWTTQLGIMVAVVGILHQMFPTDGHYLAQRVVVAANGARFVEFETNAFVAAKFVFAIIGMPAMYAYALRHRQQALRWLAISYASGAAVSGVVAFTDGRGFTRIGATLTGRTAARAREAGLSNHANFLAAACVVAIPLSIWLLASSSRRDRWIGGVTTFGLLLGTYASGSRGGTLCLGLAAVMTVLFDERFRHRLGTLLFGFAIAVVVTLVVFPGVGTHILTAVRLTGSNHTAGSNSVRGIVQAQGLRDVQFSPIDGVGLQVATEATNVYLQELASGGILLFLSMQVFTFGGMWAAYSLRREHDIANALLAALLAAAVLNVFEADLTDRFFYFPAALVGGMVAVAAERRLHGPPSVPSGPEEADQPVPMLVGG